jgi:hypothetical protein
MVAMEAILLLLYALNSAPIPGMDLSRCCVALGRDFQFLIDFAPNKHFELTSMPSTIVSYSHELATCLSALQEVASLFVKEQRAYHRKFVNSSRPDPKIYSVGNIIFARWAVCSNVAQEKVNKLTYPFTGPWRIIVKLHDTSYKVKHCISKARDKKHAPDLSPYPVVLIPNNLGNLPFRSLDGADIQFGQLYHKFKEHPYKEARSRGFTPPMPFVAPSQFLITGNSLHFTWPTLAELNKDVWSDIGPDEDEEMDWVIWLFTYRDSTPDPHSRHLYAPSQQFLWQLPLPSTSSIAPTNCFSFWGRLGPPFASGNSFVLSLA